MDFFANLAGLSQDIVDQLARISHKFLEKIAARLTGIAFQPDEDSVQATRPRPAEREDRSTECASFPRNGEKCGLGQERPVKLVKKDTKSTCAEILNRL